jgi:hypothetical protein
LVWIYTAIIIKILKGTKYMGNKYTGYVQVWVRIYRSHRPEYNETKNNIEYILIAVIRYNTDFLNIKLFIK